nr:unnamed protein product [Callosobruchus analis]
MYGLRYTRFIGDDDSSTYKRILESTPYKKSVMKIECRNHLLRNFCNKVRDICRTSTKTTNTASLRRNVEGKILKLRTAIKKAVQFRKAEAGTVQSKSIKLKRDILNVASHVWQHKDCVELGYFCTKAVPDPENIVPNLADTGLYCQIQDQLRYLSNHSTSLIFDLDSNLVESLNSEICKFAGGKRVNFSQKRQYQGRCSAAVVTQLKKIGIL